MRTQDVAWVQRAARAWRLPSNLRADQQAEWQWLVHSRLLRPETADVAKQAADEEWWVLPDVRGVLQLRRRGPVPKIHGLVVRAPRHGDGTRLVRAVLQQYPTVWVGAHPTAVEFYHKLGFSRTDAYPSTASEVAMLYSSLPTLA